MKHAIFSLDPGSTTGIAMAIFDQPNRPQPLKEANPLKRISVHELSIKNIPTPRPPKRTHTSQYETAAMILYHSWLHFRYLAKHHYGVEPEYHELVIEDYLIKPTPGSTKREALSPVYISMAFQGIRLGQALAYERHGFGQTHIPRINWSVPANKSQVEDARLRRAGLWLRGRPHGRDAVRHLMLHAMRLGYHGVLQRFEGQRPTYLLQGETE